MLLLLLAVLHESSGVFEKTYPVDDYYIYNAKEKACRLRNPIQSDLEKEFRGRPCKHFFGHLRFSSEAYGIYEKIQEIEKITGCITIIESNLVHASFPALKEIMHDENFCDVDYSLRIIGNKNLKNITFHADFTVIKDRVFASVNPLLKQHGISPAVEFDLGSTKDCLQEEAKNNKQCKRIVGEVEYRSYLYEVFKREPPVEVHGKLLFENTEEVDLSGLENVIVVGHGTPAISIKNNAHLIDVYGLLTMKLSGREPLLEISGNNKICAPAYVRKRVRKLAMEDIAFDESCLESCAGGVVNLDYLEEFDKHPQCRVINGDLIFRGLKGNAPGLERLRRIERIERGSLIFQQNIDFESIWFLKNLEVISNPESKEPVLQIANNHGLKSIGLPSLKSVRSADADKAIEIFTYEEMPTSERKRLMGIANRREVFNVGQKDIRERRKILDNYENNAVVGVLLVLIFGLIMGTFAVVLITIIHRRDTKRKTEEEKSLLRTGSISKTSRETKTSLKTHLSS